MYKIFIDCKNRLEKSVTLMEFDTENKQTQIDQVLGEIDIVDQIRKILNKHNLVISDIKEFVPNSESESFTGIKISYTIANILNWINGKDIQDLKSPIYQKDVV